MGFFFQNNSLQHLKYHWHIKLISIYVIYLLLNMIPLLWELMLYWDTYLLCSTWLIVLLFTPFNGIQSMHDWSFWDFLLNSCCYEVEYHLPDKALLHCIIAHTTKRLSKCPENVCKSMNESDDLAHTHFLGTTFGTKTHCANIKTTFQTFVISDIRQNSLPWLAWKART